MKTSLFFALSFTALLVVSGCQQAPEGQVEAARVALAQADSLEADLYAADLYFSALDSFNAAQTDIEVQEAQSGFSRDYGRAVELLTFTEQTAAEAVAQIETGKEAVRIEADSLIALAQAALLAQPAGAPSTVTDSGQPAVATLVNDAIVARDMGNYASARDLAQTAVDRLGQTAAPADPVAPRS